MAKGPFMPIKSCRLSCTAQLVAQSTTLAALSIAGIGGAVFAAPQPPQTWLPGLSAAKPGSAQASPSGSSALLPAGTANVSSTLQGSVEMTVKSALIGLNSMGEALHKLKHAASELYAECSRQIPDLVEEPEIIGGVVVQIPVSFNLSQCLPPRKKWVDYYMSELSQLIPLVQGEISGIVIPPDKQDLVAPVFTQIGQSMDVIQARYQILVGLSQSAPYDGQAIGLECQKIDNEVKRLEEARKTAFHLIKEKGK